MDKHIQINFAEQIIRVALKEIAEACKTFGVDKVSLYATERGYAHYFCSTETGEPLMDSHLSAETGEWINHVGEED